MIYKNAQYSEVTGVTVLEFGKGTILVVPATNEFHESILFKTQDPKGIGEEVETKGKNSDEFNPDVVMLFDNPDSIDIVIEALQKAKENLLSK